MFSAFMAKAGVAVASVWFKIAAGLAVAALAASIVISYNNAISTAAALRSEKAIIEASVKSKNAEIDLLKQDKSIIEQIVSQQKFELDASNKKYETLRIKLSHVPGRDDPAAPYLKEVFKGLKEIQPNGSRKN